jgi:hypothetical protein
MKVTLIIPDSTVCAFFDFVHYSKDMTGMLMQGHSIAKDELYDGAEIVIEQKDGGGDG